MKRIDITLKTAIFLMASAIGLESFSTTTAAMENENGSLVTLVKGNVAGDTVFIERQTTRIDDLVLLSEPTGGIDISTFLKDNLEYPAEALAEFTEGYVKVFFTVEKNGRLSNILALEKNNDLFASEVLKTLRKARIQPIIQNGQPARYSLIVPVYFKLDR